MTYGAAYPCRRFGCIISTSMKFTPVFGPDAVLWSDEVVNLDASMSREFDSQLTRFVVVLPSWIARLCLLFPDCEARTKAHFKCNRTMHQKDPEV